MPSKSPAQHRLMEMVAHGGHVRGGGGPSQAVAREFVSADAGMADGGEVPAISHVTEHDDHFLVHYTDGHSALVDKDGLSPDTLAHIRGMAHGGEVVAGSGGGTDPEGETDAGGGSVAEAAAKARAVEAKAAAAERESLDAREARIRQDQAQPVKMARGGPVPDAGMDMVAPPEGAFAPVDITTLPPSAAPAGMDAGADGGTTLTLGPTGGGLQTTSADMEQARQAQRGRELDAQQAAEYARMTGQQVPGQAPPETIAGAMGAPPPHNPALDVGAPSPPQSPGMGGSGTVSELDKGLAEERAALAASAETQRQKSAEMLKMADAHVAQVQALQRAGEEQLAAHQRRADDLFNATLNSKIDPNRVWASADIGQRIGASTGIILSGIGVGLAGGPNLALQVIDKTIDRDIDAQKTNLESQRSLLSHYLQQGRDMLAAQQLAKADLKDMYAAQLLKASAEYGGQEAAQRAQMAAGQLRTEAAGKRQEYIMRDTALAQTRLQMRQQQEMDAALKAALHPTNGQPAMSPEMAQLMALGPKEMSERAVRVPVFDGKGTTWQTRYTVQKGKLNEDASNAFRKSENIRGMVQELQALHREHPLGTAISGDVAKRARFLADSIKLEWLGGEAGLNRLNEREAAYLDEMVVNPADVFSTGQTGALNEMAQHVAQNHRNLENSYLVH